MELGYKLCESTSSHMIMARTYHGLFVPHTVCTYSYKSTAYAVNMKPVPPFRWGG